jgi:cytochrome c5
VFTNRQADRGQTTFERRCERCHGAELGGEASEEIPPLAWDPFITQWSGRSIGELVDRITRSMPPDARGSTDRKTATDVVAFILRFNGYPDGEMVLSEDPDAQSTVTIDKPPQRPN